jgi:hypothetical protein
MLHFIIAQKSADTPKTYVLSLCYLAKGRKVQVSGVC